jgi:hypothetical protein
MPPSWRACDSVLCGRVHRSQLRLQRKDARRALQRDNMGRSTYSKSSIQRRSVCRLRQHSEWHFVSDDDHAGRVHGRRVLQEQCHTSHMLAEKLT